MNREWLLVSKILNKIDVYSNGKLLKHFNSKDGICKYNISQLLLCLIRDFRQEMTYITKLKEQLGNFLFRNVKKTKEWIIKTEKWRNQENGRKLYFSLQFDSEKTRCDLFITGFLQKKVSPNKFDK